jgi:RTX calcium-binding nonapeptide repeat (4 copies)
MRRRLLFDRSEDDPRLGPIPSRFLAQRPDGASVVVSVRLLLASVLLVTACLPGTAEAATVRYEADVDLPRMIVRDAAREDNDLQIAERATGFEVVERGDAALRAGRDCRQVSGRRVRCPGDAEVVVRAGAGDDRVLVRHIPGLPVRISGGQGHDRLEGGQAVDGGPGADLVHGSSRPDVLRGDAGRDRLEGGLGRDALTGGPGRDVLDGGSGRDLANWSKEPARVVADLRRGRAVTADVEERLTSIENLSGTLHDDRLVGDDGPNRIYGGPGADALIGLGGNDRLDVTGRVGGSDIGSDRAADRLGCGAGDDTVIGAGLGLVGARPLEPIEIACERLEMNSADLDFQSIRVQPFRSNRVRVTCTLEEDACQRRVTLSSRGLVLGTSRLRRVPAGVSSLAVRLRRPLPRPGVIDVRVTGPEYAFRYRVRLGAATRRR